MRADETTPESPDRREAMRVAVGLAGVSLAALVAGGLTSPAQQYLPAAVNSLANSAGGWTLLTFFLVWLSRLRAVPAAFAGAAAFILMVEGYRIVSEWRGYGYGSPFQDVFTLIGLLAGPVIGVSAALFRYGSRRARAFAIAPLAVVLIGEAVYGLTVISGTTSPIYWWITLVAGVALTAVHLARQAAGLWITVTVVAVIAAGSGAFWFAYQLLGSESGAVQ